MTLKLTGITLAVAFAFATAAQAQNAQKSERKAKDAEEERIEQTYKADKEKCDALKANAKDICMAEAKGKQKVAKTELDAKNGKDQARAQKKVQDAKAEAAYEVAKERCDDQKGEAKDACVKQARVERDKAMGKAERTADAKREPRAAAGRTTAEDKRSDKPKQQ